MYKYYIMLHYAVFEMIRPDSPYPQCNVNDKRLTKCSECLPDGPRAKIPRISRDQFRSEGARACALPFLRNHHHTFPWYTRCQFNCRKYFAATREPPFGQFKLEEPQRRASDSRNSNNERTTTFVPVEKERRASITGWTRTDQLRRRGNSDDFGDSKKLLNDCRKTERNDENCFFQSFFQSFLLSSRFSDPLATLIYRREILLIIFDYDLCE